MLWLVPLFPLVAAPLLYPVWKNTGRRTIALSAGILGSLVLILTLIAWLYGWTGSVRWSSHLVLEVGLAGLTPVFALTLPLVATPILVYAAVHEERAGLARLMSFLLAFMGAMQWLLLAQDMLTLLIGWELVGAVSWALIAHHGTDAFRVRHATWAFLVTRFGDLGLYLAAAVAFSATGTLAYADLVRLEGAALHLFVAGVVLACAAKSAQLPFSPWLFAAMSGPGSVSALLHSATLVAAGVYLVATLEAELASAYWFSSLAVWLGIATALAGGLAALYQHHAKRVLAASTSAHHGLMWVAVGAGYPAVAALHFLVHAFAKAPLFLLVGAAGKRVGSHWLADLKHNRLPAGVRRAGLISIGALAGVFPLGAAWTKEAVVSAAGHHQLLAALATLLAGGLSAAYAARFHGSVFGWKLGGTAMDEPIHPMEKGAILLFAAASLAATPLWLPGSREWLMAWFGMELPAFKAWEVVVSFALVGGGLILGVYLARKPSSTTSQEAESHFGTRVELTILKPMTLLLHALGSFERRLEQLTSPSRNWANRLAKVEHKWDHAVDSLARVNGLARVDLKWDHAIDNLVYQCCRLAYAARRVAEWLFDELPEGTASLLGWLARRTVRLQTGMVHHYYSIATFGFAVMILVLIMGALI